MIRIFFFCFLISKVSHACDDKYLCSSYVEESLRRSVRYADTSYNIANAGEVARKRRPPYEPSYGAPDSNPFYKSLSMTPEARQEYLERLVHLVDTTEEEANEMREFLESIVMTLSETRESLESIVNTHE